MLLDFGLRRSTVFGDVVVHPTFETLALFSGVGRRLPTRLPTFLAAATLAPAVFGRVAWLAALSALQRCTASSSRAFASSCPAVGSFVPFLAAVVAGLVLASALLVEGAKVHRGVHHKLGGPSFCNCVDFVTEFLVGFAPFRMQKHMLAQAARFHALDDDPDFCVVVNDLAGGIGVALAGPIKGL